MAMESPHQSAFHLADLPSVPTEMRLVVGVQLATVPLALRQV